MSGVTITTTVRIGERTAAVLRSRRTQLLAQRQICVRTEGGERSVSARRAGSGTRTVAGTRVLSPLLAELHSRRRAVHQVPASLLRRVDAVLARARQGQATETAARRAVEKIELAEERRVLDRARQELVMAELLEHLPEGIGVLPGVERTADGTLRARIALAGAGEIGLRVRAAGQGLDLDMAASGVDRLATPAGILVGCEAQRALGERLCEEWCAGSIDVDQPSVASGETLAATPAPRRGAAA